MKSHFRDTSQLSEHNFDIVIVGGGISGAWLALHCSQSGYKTALVEQGDFAEKTSSASSKLLHGGIRYLQQMQFDKVRESAMERAHYLYGAPHLSKSVPFIVPTYSDFKRSKFFLFSGLCVYKALCIGENRIIENQEQQLPPFRSLSRDEVNQICDLSNTDLNGAMVFHEYHMYDSERMVLAVLQTAKEHGAHIFNYVKADNYTTEGKTVTGISATDMLTEQTLQINSRLIINSAGPWIDTLNSSLSKSAKPRISNFAIGSHLVLKNSISDHALALTTQHKSTTKLDRGGRHVFIIPWRGHSLVGTSYDEINDANKPLSLQANHVKQLLEAVNEGMPNLKLTADDVLSGYSGLYPLQTDEANRHVYQGSGEYSITDHVGADGHKGLITALGAKFTTAHVLSARTMKLVHDKLKDQTSPAPSTKTTAKLKFSSTQYSSLEEFTNTKVAQYTELPEETVRHLVSNYGSDIDAFMSFIKAEASLSEAIVKTEPDILGQVQWAVCKEMAQTLNDVLFRRTSIGLLGISLIEIEKVAGIMAPVLEWNAQEKQVQIINSQAMIESNRIAIIRGFEG